MYHPAGDYLSPLDVLLAAMHAKWEEGSVDAAVEIARIAAPFVHPRIAAAERAGARRHESDLQSWLETNFRPDDVI